MNQENENQGKTFEGSQTTTDSTGSSSNTQPTEKRRKCGRRNSLNIGSEEIKKLLNPTTREEAQIMYRLYARAERAKDKNKMEACLKFFAEFYPKRHPQSVYLTAWRIKRYGVETVYRIKPKNGFKA